MILDNIISGIKEINRKIPNIEYGGCGSFSYYLSYHLRNKYNIESEIVYVGGTPCSIKYDIHFSHILVKVDDVVIDNNGVYNYNDSYYKKLDINKLEEMLCIRDLWNDTFHRGWHCSYTFEYIEPKEKLKELIFKL